MFRLMQSLMVVLVLGTAAGCSPKANPPVDMPAADLSIPPRDLWTQPPDLAMQPPDLTPVRVTVTFRIDTSGKADGKNQLALVKSGEQVFLVGNFNGWDPQQPAYQMTAESDGRFSFTKTFDSGQELEFKFAKTGSGWGNGEKAFGGPCGGSPDMAGADGGAAADGGVSGALWEVPNRRYTVGNKDATLGPFTIDAWRDFAQTFGYSSC